MNRSSKLVVSTLALVGALTAHTLPAVAAKAADSPPAGQAANQNQSPNPQPLYEIVLNQLLGSLGRINLLARTRVSISSKEGFSVNEFIGRVQVPFLKQLVIPVVGTPAELWATSIHIGSDNLIIDLQSNMEKETKGAIDSVITFRRIGQNAQIPLVIAVKNKLSEVFYLEVYSIAFKLDGLSAESGQVQVKGSCVLKQHQVDYEKNKVQPKSAPCDFDGTFTKENKDYDFHLGFDSYNK